jgi:hypothetical protein
MLTGRVVAERLDLMGIDATAVLAWMDDQLISRTGILFDKEFLAAADNELRATLERERDFVVSLNAQTWVELLSNASEDSATPARLIPGSRAWLLGQVDYWDERYALRIVLLAFPDAEVVLDITELEENGWQVESKPTSFASNSVAAITGMAVAYAPVVVLTEGRTDAEFLSASVAILYPHLTDLIRFLDYERKPEGGVAALIRMVRAFAATGIVNRIVAIFDNDTAAADGLRTLDLANLPAQIKIVRYPTFSLLEEYPTLGPSTLMSPAGSVIPADVNGLAGSIELYLGKEVLTQADGTLFPVQWRAFIPGMGRYQGEVVNKEIIHQRFRAKCISARDDSACLEHQDWSGLRLIIDAIRLAAQHAFGEINSLPL